LIGTDDILVKGVFLDLCRSRRDRLGHLRNSTHPASLCGCH